ncbi:MAG: PHP domain-containing protein [Ignavibacteriales bacterium]|nr:PHP domain-containing protein [Ignavibacteriales bacterium]
MHVTELVGAIHMHSSYSDGTGTIEEITKAAKEIGLDYIILTDHNTLRAKNEGAEKFYGNSLLLVGYEINDKENKNHYLALRVNKTYPTRMRAKEYVRKIKEDGGFGFTAHPHEKRSSMKEHPPYPWTEWDCPEIHGIEIWNHMSEWMENLTEQNKYESFLHPLKTVSAPPMETLAMWDELNKQRKVVAIGGVDAHAHKVNVLGLFEVEVFPYKVLFKSIRTHILTGSNYEVRNTPEGVDSASKIILHALEQGNCFVANDNVHDATGFRFFADQNGICSMMGSTVTFIPEMTLQAISPVEGSVTKLLLNGKIIAVSEQKNSMFTIHEPGAYRVEVLLHKKAWIFSNHIHVVK